MAAFGALPSHGPILYAGDQPAARLRAQAAAGANMVVGDSNRRREFLPESTQQNRGRHAAADAADPDRRRRDQPVPGPGTNGQTVAVLQGARYLRAPIEPGELQFPETAPIAAFDGSLSTAWVADRNLPVADRWIEVGFNAPRDVPYVDVYPLDDPHGTVTEVDVNGIHHAVGPGWTRIPLNLRSRQRAAGHDRRACASPRSGSAAPGASARSGSPASTSASCCARRSWSARDLAGTDLSHDSLTYVFERTTGDDPFQRNPYGTTTLLDQPARTAATPSSRSSGWCSRPPPRSYTPSAWVLPGGRHARLGARSPGRLPGTGPVRLLQPLPGPAGLSRLQRVRAGVGLRRPDGLDRRLTAGRPRRPRGSRGRRPGRCR